MAQVTTQQQGLEIVMRSSLNDLSYASGGSSFTPGQHAFYFGYLSDPIIRSIGDKMMKAKFRFETSPDGSPHLAKRVLAATHGLA